MDLFDTYMGWNFSEDNLFGYSKTTPWIWNYPYALEGFILGHSSIHTNSEQVDTKFILGEFQGRGAILAFGRLASIFLRAIMPKSRSTFHSQNPTNILGNRPNPIYLKLGLRRRNFDSPGIDLILNSQRKSMESLKRTVLVH